MKEKCSNILVLYDCKTAGESSSQPNARQPPFRAKHLQSWVHAMVKSRHDDEVDADGNEMFPRGHMFAVLDGGRAGNDGSIASAFTSPSEEKALGKCHQQFHIFFRQPSVHQRKERVRGFVQQAETLHVFTKETLDLPVKPRLHFEDSTNHGTVIGPFNLSNYESADCWRVAASVKKQCLGTSGKILAGGAGPADAGQRPKFDDGEPMSWHLMCKEVYEELLHSFDLGLVYSSFVSLLGLGCFSGGCCLGWGSLIWLM